MNHAVLHNTFKQALRDGPRRLVSGWVCVAPIAPNC